MAITTLEQLKAECPAGILAEYANEILDGFDERIDALQAELAANQKVAAEADTAVREERMEESRRIVEAAAVDVRAGIAKASGRPERATPAMGEDYRKAAGIGERDRSGKIV